MSILLLYSIIHRYLREIYTFFNDIKSFSHGGLITDREDYTNKENVMNLDETSPINLDRNMQCITSVVQALILISSLARLDFYTFLALFFPYSLSL